MTVIDRIFGVAEGIAIKAPCRVATEANIALMGLQTIDDVTVAEGDRVLVKSQSNAVNNGIYVASNGNWTRARDFDGVYDAVTGSQIYITAGTVSTAHIYVVVTTAFPIVIGSTAITFGPGPGSGDLLNLKLVDQFVDGTAAAAAVGDGTVFVANGETPTLPASFPGTTFEYLSQTNMHHFNDGDFTSKVQHLFRSQPLSGSHIGDTWGAVGIESRPSGSGGAGDSSDTGLMVSIQKQNWGNSAQTGQIVGHYVHVQNDGPGAGASNDSSAYLFDLIGVHTSGYYSAIEGNLFIYNTDRATLRKGMFVQMAVSDSRTTDRMFGLILAATTGTMDKGVLVEATTGTTVSFPFEYASEHGSRWQVDSLAQMNIYPADGTSSNFFTVRNGGGSFQLVNTAGSTTFFSIDQLGIMQINGTQVLEPRQTGWNATSGTLTRGTFTVGGTLTDTQEHLAALITDLRSHGLIGT